jgi:hypothetical protein
MTSRSKYGHWDTGLVGEFNPGDHFGFVYQITHIESGKSYIGCKHLFRYKKTKRIAESDWKSYCSSSKELKPHIQELGKKAFTFVILMLCRNKRDLYYNEMRLQVDMNVLESDMFYNLNIGGRRFFRPVRSYGEEFREKIRGVNNHKYRGAFTVTYQNKVQHRIDDLSLREFAEVHGYDQSALCKVSNGKMKRHKNIIKVEYDQDN